MTDKEVFKFTRRESQVAALIARGISRKQIASELQIACGTVDQYLRNIRAKIGAEGMFEAGCILAHYNFSLKTSR